MIYEYMNAVTFIDMFNAHKDLGLFGNEIFT